MTVGVFNRLKLFAGFITYFPIPCFFVDTEFRSKSVFACCFYRTVANEYAFRCFISITYGPITFAVNSHHGIDCFLHLLNNSQYFTIAKSDGIGTVFFIHRGNGSPISIKLLESRNISVQIIGLNFQFGQTFL